MAIETAGVVKVKLWTYALASCRCWDYCRCRRLFQSSMDTIKRELSNFMPISFQLIDDTEHRSLKVRPRDETSYSTSAATRQGSSAVQPRVYGTHTISIRRYFCHQQERAVPSHAVLNELPSIIGDLSLNMYKRAFIHDLALKLLTRILDSLFSTIYVHIV